MIRRWRCAPVLWLAVAIALMAASLAFDAPWSWLAPLGALGAIVVSMERMMAEHEKRARMPRRGRRK